MAYNNRCERARFSNEEKRRPQKKKSLRILW